LDPVHNEGKITMSIRRTRRFRTLMEVAVVCAATACVVMSAQPAGVAAQAETAVAPAQGWARFGHFAPAAAPVDVLVDGAPFASALSFKQVSDYLPLPAGLHQFELRLSSDPDGPSVLSIQAGVPEGGAVTVGAVSTRDGLAPQVYDDALAAPPEGQSLVRFIHAAPDVVPVDVQLAAGPVLATGVAYPGATPYQPIAAGQYDVEVRLTGSDQVVLTVDDWSIQPAVQSSIVIVQGTDGALDVVPIRDSAAVAVPPLGGVQTGYGGMSPAVTGSTGRSPLLAGIASAMVLTAACIAIRRRLRVPAVRHAR
jgi:hypothetical protein